MAFEGFARLMNVRVQHYHADNGRFCENLWMASVKKEVQTISFAESMHIFKMEWLRGA
jgi:hypothetical protein